MLLLDSCVLLWWLIEPDRLRRELVEEIVASGDRVYVSVASMWEIEIKRQAGRLDLPGSIVDEVDEEGFTHLAITGRHAAEAAGLPMHHRDPFDRMLVAQSRIDRLTLVTADDEIARYEVALLAP